MSDSKTPSKPQRKKAAGGGKACRLERKIKRLEAQGGDVTELQAQLETLKSDASLAANATETKKTRKRKRSGEHHTADEGEGAVAKKPKKEHDGDKGHDGENPEGEDTSSQKKRKRIRKRKKKTTEAPVGGAGETSNPPQDGEEQDEDGSYSHRHILYVSQIPYDASREKIQEFFEKHIKENAYVDEHIPGTVQVRCLTHRESGKFRGICFVEFETKNHLLACLELHRSMFKTRYGCRPINVELTAYGGKNSEMRRMRIEEMRQKRDERLIKKKEKEKKDRTRNHRHGGDGGRPNADDDHFDETM